MDVSHPLNTNTLYSLAKLGLGISDFWATNHIVGSTFWYYLSQAFISRPLSRRPKSAQIILLPKLATQFFTADFTVTPLPWDHKANCGVCRNERSNYNSSGISFLWWRNRILRVDGKGSDQLSGHQWIMAFRWNPFYRWTEDEQIEVLTLPYI